MNRCGTASVASGSLQELRIASGGCCCQLSALGHVSQQRNRPPPSTAPPMRRRSAGCGSAGRFRRMMCPIRSTSGSFSKQTRSGASGPIGNGSFRSITVSFCGCSMCERAEHGPKGSRTSRHLPSGPAKAMFSWMKRTFHGSARPVALPSELPQCLPGA